MKVENIRIAVSPLTDTVYAGKLSKDKTYWLDKKDVTDDFLGAVIDRWKNTFQTITTPDGKRYRIEVKLIVAEQPKTKPKDIDDVIDKIFDCIDFDELIIWANALGVDHDEEFWLDDMWPDAEAELNVKVSEALLKAF